MTTFNLPDLGEGLIEAEVVAWQVEAGERVVADQPLVSVETDKAVVEIPSPRAGRIAKLFAKPGDVVKVGGPLVAFEDAGAAEAAAADVGTVVGEIKATGEVVKEEATAERAAPVAIKATPAVRALARRLGVDLVLVSPSGPGGAVTSADVEHSAAALAES
ncbi:MAG: biotin/lipoyl-containing protein, partial [Alphaproteobacteria bacterium]